MYGQVYDPLDVFIGVGIKIQEVLRYTGNPFLFDGKGIELIPDRMGLETVGFIGQYLL